MARMIRKEDKGPIEVKPQTDSVWICACGLSKNQPMCDGSHSVCRDEQAGKVYTYDADGKVVDVKDEA